jgi:hypothetical protein
MMVDCLEGVAEARAWVNTEYTRDFTRFGPLRSAIPYILCSVIFLGTCLGGNRD